MCKLFRPDATAHHGGGGLVAKSCPTISVKYKQNLYALGDQKMCNLLLLWQLLYCGGLQLNPQSLWDMFIQIMLFRLKISSWPYASCIHSFIHVLNRHCLCTSCVPGIVLGTDMQLKLTLDLTTERSLVILIVNSLMRGWTGVEIWKRARVDDFFKKFFREEQKGGNQMKQNKTKLLSQEKLLLLLLLLRDGKMIACLYANEIDPILLTQERGSSWSNVLEETKGYRMCG